jgi:hypothetical protein
MRARVDEARRQLDRMRAALASSDPREMAELLPQLENAVSSLQQLEQTLAHGHTPEPGLSLDLAVLSRELSIVQRLLKRGQELCSARAILVATAAGGYSASGRPAALCPGSTIRIEG